LCIHAVAALLLRCTAEGGTMMHLQDPSEPTVVHLGATRSWWTYLAPVLLAWSVLSVLQLVQVYSAIWLRGEIDRRPLWAPAFVVLARAAYLAACSPLVLMLARRFNPARPATWPLHLTAAAALTIGYAYSMALPRWWVAGRKLESISEIVVNRFMEPTLFYLFILTVTAAVDYSAWYQEQRVARAELSLRNSQLHSSLAAARLESLRAQLHPHFLFNTLNGISALARKGATEQVVRMVADLGNLLRHALENSAAVVSLRDEVRFAEQYLALERIRLTDRLRSRIEIDPEVLSAEVPTLLLQPLLENAIRHGITRVRAGGCVEIRARRSEELLEIVIADTGPGIRPEIQNGRHGIGLQNTRERLQQLYGDQFTFHVENGPSGGAVVSVTFPYRRFDGGDRPTAAGARISGRHAGMARLGA
jgi:two-component system, LytTR family, sensor kinase